MKRFALQTAERAAKTGAQAALLALGADYFDVWSVDWQQVVGMGLGGVVLSVLTSIASAEIGPKDDPSLVS